MCWGKIALWSITWWELGPAYHLISIMFVVVHHVDRRRNRHTNSMNDLETLQARAHANGQPRTMSIWRQWLLVVQSRFTHTRALPARYRRHLLILGIMVGSLLTGPVDEPSPAVDSPALDADQRASEQRPFKGVTGTLAGAEASRLSSQLPGASRQDVLTPRTPLGPNGQVYQPFTTEVVTDTITPRTGPGPTFDQAPSLLRGDTVRVLGRVESWLQIQTPDTQLVWIAADAIDIPTESLPTIPSPDRIPTPPPPLVARAIEDELNVRDGPGTDYVRMTKIDAGTTLDLIARSGDWVQVNAADGTNGWVHHAYLFMEPGVIERIPETTDIPPLTPVLLGTITEAGINLRRGPGTNYESLGKLTAGAEVTIQARYQTWYKIETAAGTVGWVARDLLGVSGYIQRRIPETADIPSVPRPVAAAQPRPAATSGAWVWPTTGRITSPYGWRVLNGQQNFHNGIDMANQQGTRIMAIQDGTVLQAGWCSGYGYCVMIDHGDGLVSEYGHMMSLPPVVTGQHVNAGQLIGYMGSTYDRAGGGYATGTHLHMTMRKHGSVVNPYAYLP